MLPWAGVVEVALRVVEKLIDGQSPEQKVKLWQQWIDFWQPLVNLIVREKK